MKLWARPAAHEDYEILDAGDPVGRIRNATERSPPVWIWHVQVLLPVPNWCNGSADSRDQAMADFREAWTRFKKQIEPERYAKAIKDACDARERFQRKS